LVKGVSYEGVRKALARDEKGANVDDEPRRAGKAAAAAKPAALKGQTLKARRPDADGSPAAPARPGKRPSANKRTGRKRH